jgi:hypothetical protein
MRVALISTILLLASFQSALAACATERFVLLILDARGRNLLEGSGSVVIGFNTIRSCERAGQTLLRKRANKSAQVSYICLDRGPAS